MNLLWKKFQLCSVFTGLCLLVNEQSFALQFEPNVGVGARYSDNATLTSDDKISDTVVSGIVGASIVEEGGPLVYTTTASVRKAVHVNDTFEDKRYLNFNADVNWELLRDRLNLYLTDTFFQRPINALDPNTPDNRQDTNIFVLGARVDFPIASDQKFTVIPQYSQYYYGVDATNNKQYSLTTSWHYKMFRLTTVGLNLNGRKIKYENRAISDTTFTSVGFIISGQRAYSNYTINLGATNVKRDTAETLDGSTNSSENTGFDGSLNWLLELSSRSAIEALVLTEITDTSEVSQITSPGNPNDVELATDVIRNSIIRLNYTREDETLRTDLWGEYRKLKYSNSTELSREIQTFGARLGFPVSQLISSGIYLTFADTTQLESLTEDKYFSIGTNVNVTLARTLNGLIDIQYRTRESTNSLQNYDEFGVGINFNYGF